MIVMLADLIRDPVFQNIYLVAAFALMVGPMIVLTIWYHGTINRTSGGQALMREQERHNKGGRTPSGAARNLKGGAGMARDIAKGAYGEDVRRLQNRTYVYVLAWVAANVIVFGALIWAQDYNQRRDTAGGGAMPTATTVPTTTR